MRRSTAALIRRGERLLFVRRPPGGDLGSCWELPGGKVDTDETPREALKRELREELGVEARVGEPLGEAQFNHSGQRFLLTGYEVEADVGRMTLHEHEELRLCTIEEALTLDLAPSDATLLRSLL